MKKILRIVIFALLTPFFFSSCNKPQPIIPPYQADVSLLTYDTMTVNYQLPTINNYQDELLAITSSDTSLFTIKDTSFTNKVVIESNLENKVGMANINFTYDNVPLEYKISVAVNYPQSMDEAVNAFSLACIKLPANKEFDLVLNFNNPLKTIDEFDASLEIYGWRGIVRYRDYQPGVSKRIGFMVDTNASYGTIPSGMTPGDNYYQYNIANFNYLSRALNEYQNEEELFYIDNVEKSLNVKNSEELFWSVEHGYRPILPDENSNLNEIYNESRNYCASINPNWSNLVKFRELFDRLISSTFYDHDPNLNSYGSSAMSYYLEGVFLDNGIAVCDGFSKAYALLCGILGLPCFRSYGFPKGENVGHAWNYVRLDDGSWYLVCPTWAKTGFSIFDETPETHTIPNFFGKKGVSLTKYDTFLTGKNYFKNMGANYSDLAWPSIKRSDTPYTGNIEDNINYHIRSDEDANRVKDYLSAHNILTSTSSGCSLYLEFDLKDQDKIDSWCPP